MKNNIYTLMTYIASEEGWHDRCGDYHSGKESKFNKQYFNDKNEASNAFGKALFLNIQNGDGVTFLINGIDMYPGSYECEKLISKEDWDILNVEFEEIEKFALQIAEQLRLEKIRNDELIKLQKEAKEIDKKNKERELIENKERADFERLMAKYGNK